ncbi:MAG: hypothetical protein OXF08_03155 [Bacteroidetes bacterium]|nr:hypothetical protein [Bacteroidota bacterium]
MTQFPFSADVSLKTFMQDYWQKRPLFLQNVFKTSDFPVCRNEIFNLATRFDFVSRFIQELDEEEPWIQTPGPFNKNDLIERLEDTNWILLVQNTEWEIDSMHELLEHFRFIPNWRLDDVQLSFSVMDGSAGPHVDSYDVFLVQLSGEKVWQIESQPITEKRSFIQDLNIQVLESFDPDQELIVKSGDILYLPPKIPHWGFAKNQCITASIGFKIPDEATIGHSFHKMAERLQWKPELYPDIDTSQIDDPGKVSKTVLDWFQNEMRLIVEDRCYLAQVLCTGITHPQRDLDSSLFWHSPSADLIHAELIKDVILLRQSPSVIVYHELDDGVAIYAMGEEIIIGKDLKPLAQLLTGRDELNYKSLSPYLENEDAMNLIMNLFQLGALIGSDPNH